MDTPDALRLAQELDAYHTRAEHKMAASELRRLHASNQALLKALNLAEAALADIGDADREPEDDLAWCERRAAEPLPIIRAAIKAAEEGK